MDERDNILEENTDTKVLEKEISEEIETYLTEDELLSEGEVITEVITEETLVGEDGEIIEVPVEQPKKRKLFDKNVIISAIIVGVVALVLATGVVLRTTGIIYDKSPVGIWKANLEGEEYSEIPEKTDMYFVFNDDGTFANTVDGLSMMGTWEDAGDGNVSFTVSSQPFSYSYKVSCEPFKSRTLVLTSEDGEKLNFSETDSYKQKVELEEEIKTDSKLIGKWVNSENQFTFEFFEDGSATVNQYDTFLFDGVYTIKDDAVVFYYEYYGELTENAFEYSIDGYTATIDGIEFVKATEE